MSALILTYNEEENIERALSELQWLERVVVLDSYSTDSTISLVNKFPNTEVHFRKFDTFANQWNFGLSLLDSKWVLSLDADYVLTKEFIAETVSVMKQDRIVAYNTRFKFVVFGKSLLRNNTTPRPILFMKKFCEYYDDGHTQRLAVNGPVSSFESYILHDDRKPLTRWLTNLDGYSVKECKKILEPPKGTRLRFSGHVRKTKVFAPFLVFFYCLLVNGAIFDGWRGWYYTLQRTLVEILFALRLVEEEKLKEKTPVESADKVSSVRVAGKPLAELVAKLRNSAQK